MTVIGNPHERGASVVLTDLATPNITRVAQLLNEAGLDAGEAGAAIGVGARVLVAGGFRRVDSALLASLPQLELIVRTGAGYDNLDVPAVRAAGVTLVVPRLQEDTSVAEYVFAGVLSLLRNLPSADRAVRDADWGFRGRVIGRSLRGMTLGIVGVGRIGTQVARLGRGFGMRVLAWHPWSERAMPAGVARLPHLADLLSQSDVVTIHCRLEPGTRKLIDEAALAQMSRGSILVNTARGGIVDEAALARALTTGHLRGAVIDTFEGEPDLSRTPLRNVETVLLTPHLAGHTLEANEALSRFAADTAANYIARKTVPRRFVVR
jgi:phosphoglycerate dehydrogenase-like enzyme